MTTHERIAAEIRAMHVNLIANMGDGYTDNAEAIAFFEGIREGYAEAIEYAEGKPGDDAEHEIADGAPSVYNHRRMDELIGTRAWAREPELASGGEDILTLAGIVLYELASEVVGGLATYYDEHADDDE